MACGIAIAAAAAARAVADCAPLLASGTGCAPAANYNNLRGVYRDELSGCDGLALVQAIVFLPSGEAAVAGQWQWITPGPKSPPVCATGTYYTDTRFSAYTATRYTEVLSATPYGEVVRLFQTFLSAENDMEWENDRIQTSKVAPPTYLVEAVDTAAVERALGARSSRVLRVPYVGLFNDQQNKITKGVGSGDYIIARVTLREDQDPAKNIFSAGESYAATWWVRSPGLYADPGPAPSWNDRLCGFKISFSYTVNGIATVDALGGANDACNDLGLDLCNANHRVKGCPFRLRIADPTEKGSVTLYRNDSMAPDDAPYTPVTFTFAPGSLNDVSQQWAGESCLMQDTGQEAAALCLAGKGIPRNPPLGVWDFDLHTKGTTANTNGTGAASEACGSSLISCRNSRAAASLYVDGLMITAGRGNYISPIYDSLSPFTQWTSIAWDADFSLTVTGGKVRTPVALQLRISDSCTMLASGVPFAGVCATLQAETASSTLWMVPGAGSVTGRYFQYQALLTSWAENRPVWGMVPPAADLTYPSCLQYAPGYDGSLTAKLRQFTVAYLPDAGRFISMPVCPAKLRAWKLLEYGSSGGAGSVMADIVDESNVPLPGYSNLPPGAPLDGRDGKAPIDPARYPRLRVQFTLNKFNGTMDPRINWFQISWDPMSGCLALDHNAVRLARGEAVQVRFCTGVTGVVEVRVHDAAGQLVKRLFKGELKVGEVCQKAWNGTSDLGDPPATCSPEDANPQGSRVAPGVYFVTVMTPAGRETARLAIAR